MSPELMHLLLILRSQILWLFLLIVLFVPLERLFAVNRQPTLRPQMLVDLGYYFLTGLIPTLILAVPLGTVAALSRQIVPDSYFLWVAMLPIGIQIAAAFAIGELGFYWGHRTMHQVPWLWRYHATHHEPERMDWLINSRAHPIDIIFTRMCGLSLVSIAGFGAPGAGSGSNIPVLVLIGGTIWSFFIHSNIRWRLGWLEHVVSSPRFHHWHHSRIDHVNRNYASILPFYDRIFGTHYLPHAAWPPSYGISQENRPGSAASGQPADEAVDIAGGPAQPSRASNASNSWAIDPSTSKS
jgi:sterol desaturase/sphingolipid hydroxylase (fatty acid hydroxylase superfamily)